MSCTCANPAMCAVSDSFTCDELAGADRRYRTAVMRERRTVDALQRAIELLSHADLDIDPTERLHLIRTLSTINRRTL